MKYIIILNDGTDEIFNMHGIKAETLQEAKDDLQAWFGEDIEGMVEDDPDREYTEEELIGADRFLVEVKNEEIWEAILFLSDDMLPDDGLERKLLHAFYDHVVIDNCIKVEGNGKYWGLESLKRIFKEEDNG